MNVCDFLLAGEPSEQPVAVVDADDREWSYGELRSAVEHLSGFIAQTTEFQDRCLIFGENSFAWIAMYLATIKAGRVAVPIPAATSDEMLARIVRNCTPRLAFVDTPRLSAIRKIAGDMVLLSTEECDEYNTIEWTEARAFLPIEHSFNADDTHLAALMYTSGSTSEPRAVMLTHHNIAANTGSILHFMGLNASDRIMCVLPLTYCFGASLLHTHLRSGASIVLERQPLVTSHMLARMNDHACTGFAGVPATYQMLLAGLTKPMSFPHLRYLQAAGGKMPVITVSQIRGMFPSQQLYLMYGQTEATARLAYLEPEMVDAKPASVGHAVPGVRLRIVDEQGNDVIAGETGEIVAEGANVAKGYWQDPEETRKAFRNGRLYTGDLATVDDSGFIYITGRARDFLKLGGVRVSFSAIEEVIAAFPGIRELAIVPKQEDVLGETVALFVSHPRGEEVRQQLIEYCALKLPFSQRPREVHFRSELPRNQNGKVDRILLSHQLQDEMTIPPFVEQLQAGADTMSA